MGLGKTYRVEFDLTVRSGAVGVRLGTTTTQYWWTTSGRASAIITSFASSSNFDFVTGSGVGFDGDIDNVTLKEVGPTQIVERSFSSGTKINIGITGLGYFTSTAYDGTTTRTVTTTAAYNTGTWLKAEATYRSGKLAILVNGIEVAATYGLPLLSLDSKYNLLNYSEQFDNNYWSKGNLSSISANAINDPTGALTADKFIENSTTAEKYIVKSISLNSGTYTFSVYLKAAERSWAALYLSTGPIQPTYFNISNGTIGSIYSGVTAIIIDAGNGWYRCSISIAVSTPATYSVVIDICDTTPSWSYTGNGTSGIYVWGAQLTVGSTVNSYQRTTTVAETNLAPLTIGNSYALDAPFPGSLALLKLSATVPTREQAQWMYTQEMELFRDNAQCLLPDSNTIVDLTYDDVYDSWMAVSSTNESYWTGLIRTKVEPVTAGSYIKLSACSGLHLAARSTTNPGVDVTVPSYNLREELVKRAELSQNRDIVTFDYIGGFTATTSITGAAAYTLTSVSGFTYPSQVNMIGAVITGTGIPASTTIVDIVGTTIYMDKAATAAASGVQISLTDFALPVGYETRLVLSAGAYKQEGSTKDWQRLYDGFKETIRFNTAPGYNVFIQLQAVKS